MKSGKTLYRFLGLALTLSLMILVGCGGSSSSNNDLLDPVEPEFDIADFSTPSIIDNTYLPMTPGVVNVHQADTEDGLETIVVEVLDDTRMVAGIECIVVRDRVFLDDLLIEDTHDWYAQDDSGNVWYMGEEVINYEYDDNDNLIDTNSDGSWEAGLDVAGVGSIAVPGILIKDIAIVGDSYQQEYYMDEAEDMAEVVETGLSLTLSDGSVYQNVVKTREWNPLEEDSDEFNYYATGTGRIREESADGLEVVELKAIFSTGTDMIPDFAAAVFTTPNTIDHDLLTLTSGSTMTYVADTEDGMETIVVEVLPGTRDVAGVSCTIVRDTVTLDGTLIEDTYDWFAQDDSGNVWYMGEEVINYEYDDQGNLLGTNDDGSWEAGVDGALPGYQMMEMVAAGDSYYQEFYPDEAEDMAMVVSLDVEVELADGTIYENCMQTIEWNPLEPESLEYKYHAPGIGLVKEEVVGSDEEAVELVSVTP